MWRYTHPNSAADEKPNLSWSLILRVLGYARPYRRIIIIVLALILFQTLVGLATPLILRQLIDVTLPNGDAAQLNVLALLLVAIPISTSIVGIAIRRLDSSIGEGVIYTLRSQLFAHLQHMSLRFFTNTRSGELTSRLNNDVVNARTAITDTLIGAITNTLNVIFTLAVMISLDWRLTVIGVLVMPLFFLVARRVGRILRTIAREQMDINAEMNAMMGETLNISGALLVKLFGRVDMEGDRFAQRAARVRDIGIRRATLGSQFWAIVGLVGVIGTALVYWVGGHFVLSGVFSIGTIVAFAAYLSRLYGPLEYLINIPVEFSTSMVSFERVFEIIDLPIEIQEKANPLTPAQVSGRLTFEDVTFHYKTSGEGLLTEVKRYGKVESVTAVFSGSAEGTANGATAPPPAHQARETALTGISFDIQPGQIAALVGPSGAGKTTLTYLIPRLYEPTGGRILLDGHDLRDLSLETLSQHIGMVTQETYLFHDTIRTNLLYARLDATHEQLEAACKAANIHDFIMGLPRGYDTVVGERGYRLSGGEKQRLALARVILKDPRILVLDEATSHLDSQNESAIQTALEAIMAGRTSIVIAHRLSTILAADLILVMDRGQIVERGTHAELLEQNGLYAHLYETQFKQQDVAEPVA
ncbi:MAG: ABC transporter ATP-binding protein/permease [Pleurocapsa minor GSE-CHR-MK-17-07R]|jgi:ATP-binding cassette subfamily B protein|nr:ABC transporter ATP-binding protein/permease [Pleurocapsa minor GSE-CHR-MK 17-07R]